MKMPTKTVIFGAVFVTLLVSHLFFGGWLSATRGYWLIRRHHSHISDELAWFRTAVPANNVIAAINAQVPPNGNLVVYSQDQAVALDIAFYCFPRTVIFRPANETHFQLEQVDVEEWVVRVPKGS